MTGHDASIYTTSGRWVSLLAPDPTSIAIGDIGHALAHLTRFGGHTQRFYSVAQHALQVSCMVPAADALAGLLHDASEAYFVDVPRPLKHLALMSGYREAESAMQQVIAARFGLPSEMPATVKAADALLAGHEALSLFMNPPTWARAMGADTIDLPAIVPLHAGAAKRAFLDRFYALTTSNRRCA